MKYKAIIFDMDGTIYLGNQLIDGALELFNILWSKEIDFYFLTNNSSNSRIQYKRKLSSLGINIELDKIKLKLIVELL